MLSYKNIFIINLLIGFTVLFIILPNKVNTFVDELSVSPEEVLGWANKFGNEINLGSTRATCYETINNNYNEMGAKVVSRDAQKLVEEMVTDIENMLGWKAEHARRIAERVEELAANHTFDTNLQFEYYNAKKIYSKADESMIDLMPDKDKVNLKYLEMHPNQVFRGVPVNFEESAVHVPVNVYEEQPILKKEIKWSLSLRDVFRNNRVVDPDINWQYFCSSTGFMRLYPAARWRIPEFLKIPDPDRKPLDLYDCRLRQWFIRAAASPKDIVILLDGSGSMMGQRKELARNVVTNILDTLTDDDYVTVLRFSDTIEPVVSCFGDSLVEANPQNIMQIKQQLSTLNTTDIANFTLALRTGFEILKNAKSSLNKESGERNTANCNQAIMLVTDGAPDDNRLDHQAIFDEYNYPRIDIRVFTYLVGKEVVQTHETNWMACRNKGYYTHVANMAEIREQVQLYLPVMSRPLVLSRNRILAFTGVYSDITDVVMNAWVWDAREREKIRQSIKRRPRDAILNANNENYELENGEMEEGVEEETGNEEESLPTKATKPVESGQKLNKTKRGRFSRVSNYQSSRMQVESSPKFKRWTQSNSNSNNNNNNYNNQDDYTYSQDNKNPEEDGESEDFGQIDQPEEPKIVKKRVPELMMTIAAPVFDTKNETNTTEKFLEKNVWKQRIKTVKSANLLGVAGVDVPIREITRLTPAYRLGVNGYSFAVNNNGHILFHPDLRVLFQDMLKPFYGSVDLTEVEIEDNEENPRMPSKFDQLRSNMINRQVSWKTIPVKLHLDTMKRVVTRNQTYWTAAIKNTPFSLGVVVPETYGKFSIAGQIEFKRKDEDYKKYFVGDKWRVHPNWVYCNDDLTSKNEGNGSRTPERRILMFLQKASQSNIRWKSPSLSPQVYEELTCNKDLVQSLIFDAKATDINLTSCGEPTDLSRYEREIAYKFGVNLTFVSTRSGFSRFEDHYSSSWNDEDVERQREELDKKYEHESLYDAVNDSENVQEEDTQPFRDSHNKAIDEVFYKRAVDFHSIDQNAFVFGVPFNAHRKPEQIARVTGSKAIFIGSNIKKAPAAVVGLQIQLNQFADRFFNSTKKCTGNHCENQCARLGSNSTSDLNCYLIDNNGYVIVSREHDHVGRHFGEIDYNLFTALLDNNVYRAVKMYDYQAICIELINKSQLPGSSSALNNLFVGLFNLQKFILTLLLDLIVITFDFLSSIRTTDAYLQTDEDQNYNPSLFEGVVKDMKGKYLPPNRTRPYTCDKEFFLYEINKSKRQELLNKPLKKEYSKCEEPCQQNFIVSAVQNTNLLLVVNKDVCNCDPIKVKITPKNIIYENDCDIAKHHKDRERVRLPSCDSFNPHEEEIKQCGFASSRMPNLILIFVLTIVYLLHKNSRFIF